jgi:hypothetical protein
MLRKFLLSTVSLSVMVALCTVMLLATVAFAQTGTADDDAVDDETAIAVVANAEVATVTQTVPVTLTLAIPGPTGTITVEVPMFLFLNIRIGFSPEMTPTVEVTSTFLTGNDEDDVTGVITDTVITDTDTTDADSAADATPTTLATVEPTSTPTVEPTVTPNVDAPTATPIATPTETPTAEPTPQPEAIAPSCPDPSTVITSPGVNEVVSGTVDIYGTAVGNNFQYYKVEYSEGADIDPEGTFAFLSDARVQITGGLLSSFDSTQFANGAYTLKLTVVDNSGNFPPACTVTVFVENP